MWKVSEDREINKFLEICHTLKYKQKNFTQKINTTEITDNYEIILKYWKDQFFY